MKIRYLGHSCFELKSASGLTVVTDPYRGVGYELPAGLSADIVTVSHGHFDHDYVEGVCTKTCVRSVEGYEGEGVRIRGIRTDHDPEKGALRGKNIVYKIEMDGLTVCHLGDIGEEFTSALQEKIGRVDILLVPVGGRYTVDAKGARAYVDGLAPKAVVPMHYRPADGSLDITGIQPFLDACGDKKVVRVTEGELEVDKDVKGIFYLERVR